MLIRSDIPGIQSVQTTGPTRRFIITTINRNVFANEVRPERVPLVAVVPFEIGAVPLEYEALPLPSSVTRKSLLPTVRF